MLDLVTTTQFRKDLKRIRKRGYDLSKLDDVLQTLLREEPLPSKYRDHALTGDFTGFRECHVEPDWLLVYAIGKEQLVLTASRTGTHSDLF
ncbi:MAG: type II toxin-antitoxin system YafQ family toxin [Schwartzia sp.]|nr:type II toxin-antitoxin system YafQ family toxin [Schwartzia sp. (in: firmicutes)]